MKMPIFLIDEMQTDILHLLIELNRVIVHETYLRPTQHVISGYRQMYRVILQNNMKFVFSIAR